MLLVVATNTPFSYQTNETNKKKEVKYFLMENNEIALNKNYKLFPF